MNKIAKQIKKNYQERFKKYGMDPRSLSWKRLGASHQRFRQIWAEINFNDRSVLDVGCGFAELARFLKKRYTGVSYTGVDIVPEFIKEAKKRFPEYDFYTRDYLDKPLKKKFDVVVASGVLNSKVGNKIEYCKKAIKTMFKQAKKVFVFNMLGGYPQPENDAKSVWYADSIEILKYCLTLTRRVILRHHYNPKDFTIFMYKIER